MPLPTMSIELSHAVLHGAQSGLPPSAHVNVTLPGARFELLVESAQLFRIHLGHALLLPCLPCLILHNLQAEWTVG